MQNKPNFQDVQMNVNSILTKDYKRNDIFAVPENKANSNPIKANLLDAQMNATSFITKEYENKPRLPAPGKQTQSNPISPLPKSPRLPHLTHRFPDIVLKNLRFCLKNPLICVKIGKIPPEFFLFLLLADVSIFGAATSIGSGLPARIFQSLSYIPP